MSCETHKKRMVTVTRVRSSQRPLFTALPVVREGIRGLQASGTGAWPGGNVDRGPLPHSPSGLVFAREGARGWGGALSP